MLVKIFFLGRPGSGKTTAIQELCDIAHHRAYSTICMDDYHILSRMSQEDTQRKKFRTTNYGGFDVLDPTVFDTALEILEQQVQTALQTERDGIITIEFARNDYRQALRRFSPDFLKDAYIFFIEANLNTCIQRIRQRATNPITGSKRHFVSDYVMHTYYSKDNWTYIIDEMKAEYTINKTIATYYNTGSLPELLEVVNEFAEHLFDHEFCLHNSLLQPSKGRS